MGRRTCYIEDEGSSSLQAWRNQRAKDLIWHSIWGLETELLINDWVCWMELDPVNQLLAIGRLWLWTDYCYRSLLSRFCIQKFSPSNWESGSVRYCERNQAMLVYLQLGQQQFVRKLTQKRKWTRGPFCCSFSQSELQNQVVKQICSSNETV